MAIVWSIRARAHSEFGFSLRAALIWIGGALAGCWLTAVALAADDGPDWIYVMRPNDTLVAVARELLFDPRDWRRLVQHNSIADPRKLQPGDRLRIPVAWLRRQPAQATVLEVRGDAQLITRGATTPLKAGMKLGAGNRLSVGKSASVTLQFADGSELELSENSHLALDALSTLANTGMVDTRLRLQRGRSQVKVVPFAGPGSRFEIETPTATAAVRGTDFRASAVPEKKVSRSEVIEGTVGLAASGVDIAIPAGFGTVAEAGKPPLKPRPLLPAPVLPPYSDVFKLLPVRFAWPAITGAMNYRVRLIPGANQPGQVREFVIKQTELSLDDIRNGEYQLSVRGIDSIELEGFDAVRAIRVQAQLPAPQPVSPKLSSIERVRNPKFQWAALPGAKRYRLTLMHADTANRIGQWETEKPEFALPSNLEPGHYTWQLAALDARGQWGETSPASAFRVKDPPQSPALGDSEETVSSGLVQWKRKSPEERVRVQLAKDRNFESVLKDETLDADQWAVPILPPGTFFIRLSTIDADGEESAFGPVRPIVIPLPPLPLAPQALTPGSGTITRTCDSTFEWTAVERARDYQFVLRDAHDPRRIAFEAKAIHETRIVVSDTLVPGIYDWIVSARDQYDRFGPSSAPTRWVCKAEPPVLEFVTAAAEGNTVLLRWQSTGTPDARYDVELARDSAFEQIAQQRRTSIAETRWENIEPGRYYARVRVVDPDGYIGAFGAVAAIEVREPPPPAPRALGPASGTITRDCLMQFEWTTAERARDYRLVLRSADGSRTTVIDTGRITDTRYRLRRALTPGTYEWSVTARDEHDRFSPPSERAQLVCKAQPPVLAIDSAIVISRTITLSWPSAGTPGSRYDVQLAQDAGFTQLFTRSQTSIPELTVNVEDEGTYFARVRVVEPDGYTGAFGPASPVEVELPARR